MKVTVERMPGSVVNLDISADPEEFSDAVEKTFRELSREATIPGFRRGKAPRQIIEQRIGRDAIVQEAGRNIMDDLYRQALDDEELQPISEPRVDIYNDDPIAFRVEVEVFPKVEVGDYKSVRVEPREVDVTEEEIEEEIQNLLKNQAEWEEVPIARAPREGDQVVIDLNVFDGDEEFQEPAQDAEFVLGEDNLFDSLEEALMVMEPGMTSEVTLAFEEDDTSVRPPLRGKTLRYVIVLKQVNTRKLPELNDEFAQEVGEFETVDELREEVRKDILRSKAQQTRTEVVQEIIDGMVETSTVEVPTTMVESELDDALQQMRTRMSQQGLSFDDFLAANSQTEEELRESFREDAESRVRQTLVLQEVYTAEGLEVTDEDIDQEIDKLIGDNPNSEQMRQLYRSDYFKGMLENEIHDRKLMEHIVDLATEGQGAISGAGAALIEEDEQAAQAPAAETEEVETDDEDENVVEVEANDSAEAETEEAEAEEEADLEVDAGKSEEEDSDSDEDESGDEEEQKKTNE